MNSLAKLTLITALLFVTACGGGIRAVSGPVAINDAYSVNLERDWNLIPDSMDGRRTKGDRLTQDGPSLNMIYLIGGLEDGDYILRPQRKEQPTPTYTADMSELELVEFVTDTLAAYGYLQIETENVRPEAFGSADGIGLEFTANTARGLKQRGAARFAETGDGLNLIIFTAPEAHYYDAYIAEVTKLFGSIALTGS